MHCKREMKPNLVSGMNTKCETEMRNKCEAEMSVNMDKLQKTMVAWCWKVVKRRLVPNSLLFEDGDLYLQLGAKYLPLDIKQDMEELRTTKEFPCGYTKCSHVFDSLIKYESHYNMVHRNVCQTCSRVFPSAHLLDVHVLETHDTMFELLSQKQNMYQCLLEDCDVRLNTSHARKNHMIKVHKFPANYRYDRIKNKCKAKSKPKLEQKVSMEVDVVPEPDQEGEKAPVQPSGRVFSYKVPQTFSFGQGVPRGFQGGRGRGRGRGQKKKHWHNKDKSEDKDTAVNIEEVSMTDLSEALG